MITCTFTSSFTDTDPDTLLAILRPSVRELGHGVRLCKVDSVESRTLVAFVATGGTFRIGYAYRNGRNIVVYCRNNMTGAITARSPPVGVLVLNFTDCLKSAQGGRTSLVYTLSQEGFNIPPSLTPRQTQ